MTLPRSQIQILLRSMYTVSQALARVVVMLILIILMVLMRASLLTCSGHLCNYFCNCAFLPRI